MTSSRPGKTLDRPIGTKSSAFPVLLGLTSSRDVFQRSGPVSPGSDIAAAYRTASEDPSRSAPIRRPTAA